MHEFINRQVREYLEADSSQTAIEAARSELRLHRLGRQPRPGDNWEEQQVKTVRQADALLKKILSATLESNIQTGWRR